MQETNINFIRAEKRTRHTGHTIRNSLGIPKGKTIEQSHGFAIICAGERKDEDHPG